MNKSKKHIILTLILIISMIVGCESESVSEKTSTTADTKINVLSTTTMLNDMATIIGGDKVHAVSLLATAVDPHTYQATALDVEKMNNADVILYNGFNLEAKLESVILNLESQGKNIICVENALDADDILYDAEEQDAIDPHVWNDISLWIKVSMHVAESLSNIDPTNSDIYNANAENFVNELYELEEYVINRTLEISEEKRIIVSAHDAFGYLGNAYGYTVAGLQGINTEVEASTLDVILLADFIVENNVPAIFTESAINIKTLEALQEAVKSRGFDVILVEKPLYSDYLGDETTDTETYIKTFKHNIDSIVDALK
ncbi:MAG: zinc ABC transporter substrate-binding protein [Clostridia bacterium]